MLMNDLSYDFRILGYIRLVGVNVWGDWFGDGRYIFGGFIGYMGVGVEYWRMYLKGGVGIDMNA